MNWKRAAVWGAVSGWALGYLMLLAGQSVGSVIQVGSFTHSVLLMIHWPIMRLADRFYHNDSWMFVSILIIVCYWMLIGVVVALISLKSLSLWRRDHVA